MQVSAEGHPVEEMAVSGPQSRRELVEEEKRSRAQVGRKMTVEVKTSFRKNLNMSRSGLRIGLWRDLPPEPELDRTSGGAVDCAT